MNKSVIHTGVQLFIIRAKKKQSKKSDYALWIALLIHAVGLIGILYIDRYRFVVLTPINLLIMAGFLLRTRGEKNYRLYVFALICWTVGMLAEITGVQTGILFGSYRYGKWLGPAFAGVPLLIGVNWFIIICCSAALAHKIFSLVTSGKNSARTGIRNQLVFILAGALLATIFDWIMEPGAVKLGFWIWKGDGSVPFLNYVCWFALSAMLLFVFQRLRINPVNRFAVQLYFIQAIFFVAIRFLG